MIIYIRIMRNVIVATNGNKRVALRKVKGTECQDGPKYRFYISHS